MTNAEAPRLSMRQRRITGLVIYNALMVLLCLVIIYPLIWTIFSSFKTNQQIFSESPINLIPRPFTTGNYQKLLTIYDVPLMVFNGLYLAIVIPVLSMLTSSMAAYALARLRFRGRNVIFLLLISTMMIPGYVTLIPNFAIMVKLKLLNSHWALILRSAAATCIIPMQDWLGLDNSARINKPSTVGENWRWRLKKSQLTPKLQKEICSITTRYGRMNWA